MSKKAAEKASISSPIIEKVATPSESTDGDLKLESGATGAATTDAPTALGGGFIDAPSQGALKRQLKNRHIAMISIGGVIGTGLFLGTATSLKNGGPIGLLLGFATMGTICYSVMISLGEMIAYLPVAGGHITLASRFVNQSFAFAMGWNYWYNWTIILPAELSASAVLINYWTTAVNNSVWITVCTIVVVFINILGVGIYGEAEFIFASIKVLTIVGLIILGIIIDLGGGPSGDRIGFRYWKDPGPFVQFNGIEGNTGRFLGWWSVMTQAAFSFIGTEIVAIAAGEAKNPRRNLPKAIRRVYVRILLFYIGGTLIIGLITPSNHPSLDLTDKNAAASPFVIAIQEAGIKTLPSIVNACLLSSAWSAASSDLYTSSRALYGLALSNQAPKIFTKTSKKGLPWVSVIFCSLFSALAYMGVEKGAGRVFGWLANMTAVAGLMTWFGISFTYIRFYNGLRAQNISRDSLPYKHPLNPYAAYYAGAATLLICLFSGWTVFLKGKWNHETFVTNYFPLVFGPVLYIGARWYNGKRAVKEGKPSSSAGLVKLEDMDFITGVKEAEDDSYEERPPRNVFERFWRWLM